MHPASASPSLRGATAPCPVDVVVVPDFGREQAATFVVRTLFLLASWIEHAGHARRFPLHLACIGEPPDSVRWLAEHAGASITVHEPLRIDARGCLNKLRGLEVCGSGGQVLLLDADVLVLADPSDIAALGVCIAAAPANQPRVPDRNWDRIYAALALPLPAERIASVRGAVGMTVLNSRRGKYPGQYDDLGSMLPYFNAGVVFAPSRAGLRQVWEEHARTIVTLFHEGDEAWRSVLACDQPAFATAVAALSARGVPFRRLPNHLHGNWLHLARGGHRLADMTLFHALRIFSTVSVTAEGVRRAARNYPLSLLMRAADTWRREGFRPAPLRHAGRLLADVRALGHVLRHLFERHVEPALHHRRPA